MFHSNNHSQMEANTATPVRARNCERFIEATGKTEAEYQAWASQVGRQMHINTHDRLICAKLGIYTVAHLPQLPTRIPEGMWNEAEVDEHLLVHSENPLELARLWQSYRAEANAYMSIEVVLHECLRPFPKDDFTQNGDANWLPDVSKSWFKKTGLNLDVQVDEINEMAPFVITMDDVLEFVRKWKPGAFVSPPAIMLERIEERWKELTTFKIKDYYVEHLIKSAMIVQAYSTEETPF